MLHVAQVQPSASVSGSESDGLKPGIVSLKASSLKAVAEAVDRKPAGVELAIAGLPIASTAAREPAQPNAVNTVC